MNCTKLACTNQRYRRELCLDHYRDLLQREEPSERRRVTGTLEDRFWVIVTPGEPDECWLWPRRIDQRSGYGVIWFDGRPQNAQRLAWIVAYGPIPDGLHVLHKCDVRACVNPRHLFLGTNLDNIADKCAKGRQPQGERNSQAKLTIQAIGEIFDCRRRGMTQRAIAVEYGVSASTINAILNGKSWSTT